MTSVAVETIDSSLGFIVPTKKLPMAEWLRECFTDRRGVPFQESQVPWVTAPNGPCDAVDNPQYQEVWLQWAARTFKTTFGQAVQSREGEFAPKLMMFATRNENLCKQVLSRFYECLEQNPYFCDLIPPEKVRNATSVDLGKCKISGTWAGSKSGLADESIAVGHANEVDKWEHPSTSEEGDPLPRFLKRGGEFPDRKFLIESTPAQHNRSRIEAGRLLGTDCRYWVPCPHCEKFQEIVGPHVGGGPPGIFWDKGPDGHSNIELAEQTARYVCGHCRKEIGDEHRFDMSNRGVWVPAGCTVNHKKALQARQTSAPGQYPWLKGTPLRSGRIYSSQMSVFHALFHGWGEIAGDYLRKRKKEADIRQWITEEAGETWRPRERSTKATWEELAEKLILPGCPRGIIPEGFSLVTVQFDRQEDESETLPFLVSAWDPERRCHFADYGYCSDLEAAASVVVSPWQHQDEGSPVKTARVMLDSGFEPAKQAEFAQLLRSRGFKVQLVKGASQPLDTLYTERKLDQKSATPGEVLMRVDALRSQDWIEEGLFRLERDAPGGISTYDAEIEEHQDLCIQLLNEDVDEKGRWNKISDDDPNDYRDCARYGKAGMERETRGRSPRRRRTKVEQREALRKKQLRQQQRQRRRRRPSNVRLIERSGGWI